MGQGLTGIVASPKAYKQTLSGNSQTIKTIVDGKYTETILVDCGGSSRTGIILQAGFQDGQPLTVVNSSDGDETITFAASATSNVALGAGLIIARDDAVTFRWSEDLGEWVSALGKNVIPDETVGQNQLVPSYRASHVVKYAGEFTWSGGGASATETVTGAAATDIVIATIQSAPSEAAYIASAAVTANTVTVTLSAANTSNDAVISYIVLRAT